MAHSDDNGLVLPPKLAPIQVVIVPIYKTPEDLAKISAKVEGLVSSLRAKGITVKYDDADNKRPGFKFADYEVKGVPVRLALGMRDLEAGTAELMRRDTLEKETVQFDGLENRIPALLDEMQTAIFEKAKSWRDARIVKVNSYDEFKEQIEAGRFVLAHWDGTAETEAKIKEETKATIRCIPMDFDTTEEGECVYTGKPSHRRVMFARSY